MSAFARFSENSSDRSGASVGHWDLLGAHRELLEA